MTEFGVFLPIAPREKRDSAFAKNNVRDHV
jgi:hypothetical protein